MTLQRKIRKLKAFGKALSEHSSLTAVVMALNGDNPLLQNSEDRAALVRYVEAWNTAKRNPWKMRLTGADAERFSLSKLERVWTWKLARIGIPPYAKQSEEAVEAGGAYWFCSPTGKNRRDLAAMFVGMLLTNPLRGKLSDGPCQRTNCKRWFIKPRPSQKNCPGRCSRIVKNAERIHGQRDDAKTDKLKSARAAQQAWRRSDTKLDWKAWVSKETKLSEKFLSRNTGRGRGLRTPHKLKAARLSC
jgi:hypothetical protein